jgi:hypothetical protein
MYIYNNFGGHVVLRLVMLMLVGSLFYSVSAMDIESQILKIRGADDSQRYKLVNELKRELSKLGSVERTHAILALKRQMSAPSGSDMVAMSNETTNFEQNQQNAQHNILDRYESVATIDTGMAVASQSKGGVGSEVLGGANADQVIAGSQLPTTQITNNNTPQVTPSRPADTTIVQQVITPTNPIVNNVTSNLPKQDVMQPNMRMMSYQI